jgi:transporter family protein
MKHLPLTIVGPINATRPVMVLVGAMLLFGERLNLYQWVGVMLAILSFFMLSRSGKKEGIDFAHNKWIFFIVLAAITGAISGLYDKFLMRQFNRWWCSLGTMYIRYLLCAPFGFIVVA